jgi:hypothetical protein
MRKVSAVKIFKIVSARVLIRTRVMKKNRTNMAYKIIFHEKTVSLNFYSSVAEPKPHQNVSFFEYCI